MTTNDQTTAQQLQFQLQWLGVMSMSGRKEEADNANGDSDETMTVLRDSHIYGENSTSERTP